jgi:4-aminobutyrate aminotransferase/(S)-3-amino-2-methylpropionate transaminase
MIAVELVVPGTKEPYPAAEIARRCHEQGLLVLTAGTYGNVLRFLPPLVIPDALLEEGLDILDAAFDEVAH